jgi:PAS domain S-box-containing protein
MSNLTPPIDYRPLFDKAPAPLLVIAADSPRFTIVDVNDAYLQATLQTREGLLGLALFEAMPDNPQDIAANGVANLQASIERAIASKQPDHMPVQKYDIPRPGGGFEERWWDPINTPVLDATGEVSMVIHYVTDATERVRAHASLRQLNDDLEGQVARRTAERDRIWQLSANLMLVARMDGTILNANPAWERILGRVPSALMGRNIAEFKHPDEIEMSTAEMARLQGGGYHSVDFEDRYRHVDGSWHWVSWTIEPEGGVLYCNGRDVTAEKEHAEVLRLAQEALRQSQKMEAVGQLTGGLAHDFNNLLGGVSGSLELIQARMRDGRLRDVEKYTAAALGATRRAAALTHRLLAFSRRQVLAPQATNVNGLVGGMVELIQRTVGPGITIEVRGKANAWPALIDPSQLENALLNLCINARDAMPEGGRILIETANIDLSAESASVYGLPAGQYLAVQVTDSGIGMAPDVVARAFEPFFTTKPLGQGTGLGLSMIYGFAHQSGGQVRIASEPGKGTTVAMYLPRHHGAAQARQGSAQPSELLRFGQGQTVLVVDDEPTVRMLLIDILADLGLKAIEAGDSAAGLHILRSNVRIDLLVSDIGLPGGMDGLQMVDAARAARPNLNVLFITGYSEDAVQGTGRLPANEAVISKPFAIEQMAERIREMVGPQA